jgi:hypothetical protein
MRLTMEQLATISGWKRLASETEYGLLRSRSRAHTPTLDMEHFTSVAAIVGGD